MSLCNSPQSQVVVGIEVTKGGKVVYSRDSSGTHLPDTLLKVICLTHILN